MMPANSKRNITGKGFDKGKDVANSNDNSQIQLVQQNTENAHITPNKKTDNGLHESRGDSDYDQQNYYFDKMAEKKKSKIITRENLVFGKIPDPDNPYGFHEEKLSIMDHQQTMKSFEKQNENKVQSNARYFHWSF